MCSWPGFPVRDDLILDLARVVDDDTLTRLEHAYGNGVKILALDVTERETIIRPGRRSVPPRQLGR